MTEELEDALMTVHLLAVNEQGTRRREALEAEKLLRAALSELWTPDVPTTEAETDAVVEQLAKEFFALVRTDTFNSGEPPDSYARESLLTRSIAARVRETLGYAIRHRLPPAPPKGETHG